MSPPSGEPHVHGARPFVVMIRPGPSWKPRTTEWRLARLFGAHFDGEIWTAGHAYRRDEPGQLRVVSHSTRPLGRVRMWLRSLARGIRIRLRRGRPMVVITYDPFLTGTLGLALKWLTGARFVCEVNGPYGQAVTFAEGTPGALARVKPAIMRSVGGAVLRHADAVKLLYRGQLDGLPVEEGALAPEVFFNAVDSSVFSPIAEVEQEDLILFVGFPFKLKGVDLLLEAFAEVAPDFPGWRLAMIGFRLEEAAIEEGHDVPPGATFFPPEPPERIREWMARCKIFVLPSRAEAMGRVLVEAALMGRARLAARVGGIPTIVEDEVDGLLFDPGDAGDLARQLRRLMEDRPLRRRIEAATLERAESFREEVYVERYRRLIEELAGGSPRPDGSPPRSKR